MPQLLPILESREVTPDLVRLPARSIWNQGEVDCCLSCAWTTTLEALRTSYPALSPLFHYYEARIRSGQDPRTDFHGLAWEHGFLVVRETGISSYSRHSQPPTLQNPITSATASLETSSSARSDAAQYRLGTDQYSLDLFRRLGQAEPERDWVAALGRAHPILMILQPDSSYWAMRNGAASTWHANGGITFDPLHAVAIIGFFRESSSFVVQDSRGPEFGRGGQWLLPFTTAISGLIHSVYEIGESPLTLR
jgi:hypothetical protein